MERDGLPSALHHPIGFSGHVNEYRKGVCQGNYAEELLAADYRNRPGFPLDTGGKFEGTTTTRSAFTPQGKSGSELAAAAQRQDLMLKYVKYGTSNVMPEDGTRFYATVSQLAYGEGAGGAAAAAAAAAIPAGRQQAGAAPAPKVQDCLWGNTKFDNYKVPVSVHVNANSEAVRRQMEAEAAANPYRTVQKDCLEAAARDPAARLAAKPPLAQPRDVRGESTTVGCKPTGPFTSLFDKDYVRIGLRKK